MGMMPSLAVLVWVDCAMFLPVWEKTYQFERKD